MIVRILPVPVLGVVILITLVAIALAILSVAVPVLVVAVLVLAVAFGLLTIGLFADSLPVLLDSTAISFDPAPLLLGLATMPQHLAVVGALRFVAPAAFFIAPVPFLFAQPAFGRIALPVVEMPAVFVLSPPPLFLASVPFGASLSPIALVVRPASVAFGQLRFGATPVVVPVWVLHHGPLALLAFAAPPFLFALAPLILFSCPVLFLAGPVLIARGLITRLVGALPGNALPDAPCLVAGRLLMLGVSESRQPDPDRQTSDQLVSKAHGDTDTTRQHVGYKPTAAAWSRAAIKKPGGRPNNSVMPSAVVRALSACLLLVAAATTAAASHEPTRSVPPDDALLLLRDGNRRFVADQSVHFQQDALRRSDIALNGQKPFTVILTCSDSRVPPELIFDQGLGCLFVIRVAGNVAQTDEVATVEYGVGHLGARLVVVLGHTRCGAVTAVVDEAHVGPNLAKLVAPIVPAATRARSENPGKRGAPLVAAAIRANIEQAMGDLLRLSPEISLAVANGEARLVGALYDLESGEVQFLETKAVPAPIADPEFAPKTEQTSPHGHH